MPWQNDNVIHLFPFALPLTKMAQLQISHMYHLSHSDVQPISTHGVLSVKLLHPLHPHKLFVTPRAGMPTAKWHITMRKYVKHAIL